MNILASPQVLVRDSKKLADGQTFLPPGRSPVVLIVTGATDWRRIAGSKGHKVTKVTDSSAIRVTLCDGANGPNVRSDGGDFRQGPIGMDEAARSSPPVQQAKSY
jgi:hypothetical protein